MFGSSTNSRNIFRILHDNNLNQTEQRNLSATEELEETEEPGSPVAAESDEEEIHPGAVLLPRRGSGISATVACLVALFLVLVIVLSVNW